MRLMQRIRGGLQKSFGGYEESAPLRSRRFAAGSGGIDWERVGNDYLQNAAAYSAYAWIVKNANQAIPYVERRNWQGEREAVTEHPLTRLLLRPNGYYSWQCLNAGIVLSLLAEGNAFLGVERDGAGLPAELFWLPHGRVSMQKEAGSGEPFDYWEFCSPEGAVMRVDKRDIVHIRMGIDPDDPRRGMSPLKRLKRQLFTLDQGANYTANLMRNGGAIGLLATPAGSDVIFDPQDFVERMSAKTTGDRLGGLAAYDAPVQVQKLSASPQDLSLETVLDRPEADICAVLGVSAQVLGLQSGRLSKTYANLREAREVAWEETVLPLLQRVGSDLGFALLPEMSAHWEHEAVAFDVSEVRPLQPDMEAMRVRIREDWRANLIDRATWKRLAGLAVLPEDRGVYYADVVRDGSSREAIL